MNPKRKEESQQQQTQHQHGAGKSNECGDGVLLSLRILKELSDVLPDTTGYFLGTVTLYRSAGSDVGKDVDLEVGKYLVKFDYGGVEQMLPDEVIQCANLFEQMVSQP